MNTDDKITVKSLCCLQWLIDCLRGMSNYGYFVTSVA